MGSWGKDVANKQRFEFGKNWEAFLSSLNENQINEAEKSLVEMLGASSATYAVSKGLSGPLFIVPPNLPPNKNP